MLKYFWAKNVNWLCINSRKVQMPTRILFPKIRVSMQWSVMIFNLYRTDHPYFKLAIKHMHEYTTGTYTKKLLFVDDVYQEYLKDNDTLKHPENRIYLAPPEYFLPTYDPAVYSTMKRKWRPTISHHWRIKTGMDTLPLQFFTACQLSCRKVMFSVVIRLSVIMSTGRGPMWPLLMMHWTSPYMGPPFTGTPTPLTRPCPHPHFQAVFF